MKMRGVIILALVFAALGSPAVSRGEGERLILTWSADSYYPAFYGGKAPATRGAPVSVSAELLAGKKLEDLSDADFIWRLDNQVLARGRGEKEAVFTVQAPPGGRHFVRATVKRGDMVTEATIDIPVARPELVLELPSPNGLVSAGRDVTLKAAPYFFKAASFKDFEFSWQIDGGRPQTSGGDNQLKLKVPPLGEGETGREILVTASVRNKVNFLESAREILRVVVR